MTNRARKQERRTAHNPRKLTEQHQAMVEMCKTATRRETAKHFGVPVSQVTWAESVWHWHYKGAALLAADPESIEGLGCVGEISNGLSNCLQYFCGSAEELKRVPDHEDYRRISDVLVAGASKIRNRWAMGPARWAEWLAFMEARGLEWDKPLSDASPNAPAKPLQPGWNVYQFPTGSDRVRVLSRNGKIRQGLVMLDREIDCFRRQLGAVADENLDMRCAWPALETGIRLLWEGLANANIVAGDAS